MTVRVSTRAYRDLSEIWNYIANDNPVAADDLEARLFAGMKLLGEQPEIGHVRVDVGDNT